MQHKQSLCNLCHWLSTNCQQCHCCPTATYDFMDFVSHISGDYWSTYSYPSILCHFQNAYSEIFCSRLSILDLLWDHSSGSFTLLKYLSPPIPSFWSIYSKYDDPPNLCHPFEIPIQRIFPLNYANNLTLERSI